MRIRFTFAGSFLFLLAILGYAGLSSQHLSSIAISKFLHAVFFFILTTSFYWILDTSRRRSLSLSLFICTGVLGVGFELLKSMLVESYTLDLYGISANVAGSLTALVLSSWYHIRMLRRKRQATRNRAAPGNNDLELDEATLGATIDTDSSISIPTLVKDESGIRFT